MILLMEQSYGNIILRLDRVLRCHFQMLAFVMNFGYNRISMDMVISDARYQVERSRGQFERCESDLNGQLPF